MDALAKTLDIDIDRPLTQMSSGMKRKVALLTVLVPDVPLIVLDEPTNTLDPTMRDELLDQLRQAKARGPVGAVFVARPGRRWRRCATASPSCARGRLVHLQEMAELREGRTVHARLTGTPPALGPGDTLLSAEELTRPAG